MNQKDKKIPWSCKLRRKEVLIRGIFFGIIFSWFVLPMPAGALSFAPSSNYGTGTNPYGITTGDFNRDGKTDLAVVNRYASPPSVTIFLGNGGGGFSAGNSYGVGDSPLNITAVDVNGDGIEDLITSNAYSNTISVLIGNGDATFQNAATVSVGSFPHFIGAGDFNRDGKMDLAVPNADGNNISVLLGNGDGTFQPVTGEPPGTGSHPNGIVVADFNRDGKLDLATANAYGNNVSVFLGNGVGYPQLLLLGPEQDPMQTAFHRDRTVH